MKSNPLIPFGITFVLGIVLMFIISFYGISQLNQSEANGNANASPTTENDGGTNSASADPKQIFEGNCSSCHGKNLEGGLGPALNHIGSTMNEQQIRKQIKTGGGLMPPNVIKGKEADAVAKWLAEKK